MKRAKKIVKRVYKFGRYSCMLIVPKKWIEDMGILDSGVIEMSYNEEDKSITTRNANLLGK